MVYEWNEIGEWLSEWVSEWEVWVNARELWVDIGGILNWRWNHQWPELIEQWINICNAVSGKRNDHKCRERRKWAESNIMVSEGRLEEWWITVSEWCQGLEMSCRSWKVKTDKNSHMCKTLRQKSVANWSSDTYRSGCYKARFVITSGCDSYLKDNDSDRRSIRYSSTSAFEIFLYFPE